MGNLFQSNQLKNQKLPKAKQIKKFTILDSCHPLQSFLPCSLQCYQLLLLYLVKRIPWRDPHLGFQNQCRRYQTKLQGHLLQALVSPSPPLRMLYPLKGRKKITQTTMILCSSSFFHTWKGNHHFEQEKVIAILSNILKMKDTREKCIHNTSNNKCCVELELLTCWYMPMDKLV